MTERAEVDITGVKVATAGVAETVAHLMAFAADDGTQIAVGVNAHTCNLFAENPAFAAALRRCEFRYADGVSIVMAGRLLGAAMTERVATTDLIEPLAAAAAAGGKRVFLYGGRPGVAQLAAEKLVARHPGLLTASAHGYHPPARQADVIAAIKRHRTNILLVGLGEPYQLLWSDRHREALSGITILTCGGLFDWVSERRRRAPEPMIELGMEWLWRLALEPGRLAARYLLGNPEFTFRLLRQVIAERLARRIRLGAPR